MKCGSCKYFGKEMTRDDFEVDEYDIPSGFHKCERIKHDKNHTLSLKEKAVLIDGSGYFAAIRVKEDFGCQLWESK